MAPSGPHKIAYVDFMHKSFVFYIRCRLRRHAHNGGALSPQIIFDDFMHKSFVFYIRCRLRRHAHNQWPLPGPIKSPTSILCISPSFFIFAVGSADTLIMAALYRPKSSSMILCISPSFFIFAVGSADMLIINGPFRAS